jgi:LysM domain.
MSKRNYAIIFVILIAAMILTACDRSASISPVTTTTSSSEIPFPVATQSQIMKDILAATQTAAAMSGTLSTGSLPGVATSTPAFTYVTATSMMAADSGVTPTESDMYSTPVVITDSPVPTATATALPTATPLSAPTATAVSAPSATPIVVPTATPGLPSSYTIQKGEFPFCIARRFNLNVNSLLSMNGLNIYSVVYTGTVLRIPTGTTWSTGPRTLKAHPATYTVAYGDTIGSIACQYGDVDPNMIFYANGLSQGTALSQGQVLRIP